MLGHVSESESEFLSTRAESILETVEKSNLNTAFWIVVALAAHKSVAPSLIHSWLDVEFGEKTDPARNSQRCRVFSSWRIFPVRSSPSGCLLRDIFRDLHVIQLVADEINSESLCIRVSRVPESRRPE